MPFECGIDFGLKLCGKDDFHEKKFLILKLSDTVIKNLFLI